MRSCHIRATVDTPEQVSCTNNTLRTTPPQGSSFLRDMSPLHPGQAPCPGSARGESRQLWWLWWLWSRWACDGSSSSQRPCAGDTITYLLLLWVLDIRALPQPLQRRTLLRWCPDSWAQRAPKGGQTWHRPVYTSHNTWRPLAAEGVVSNKLYWTRYKEQTSSRNNNSPKEACERGSTSENTHQVIIIKSHVAHLFVFRLEALTLWNALNLDLYHLCRSRELQKTWINNKRFSVIKIYSYLFQTQILHL